MVEPPLESYSMLFLFAQTWDLWANTELLLDVCRYGDTVYMATAGGLLLSDGARILKTYTKLDGLKSTQVLSVVCEGGDVWVLTRNGIQHRDGERFRDVSLIVFGNPEEILGARRIVRSGDFLFILGKTHPTALRLSDTVEIPFPTSIGQTNVLKVFGDTVVVGGPYGALYSTVGTFFISSGWDTLISGVEVYDVDTFRGRWVFATDTGVIDLHGNVSLAGTPVGYLYSRNDTLWVSADRALFVLDTIGGDPLSDTTRIRDGDVRYLGNGFVGFGYVSDPSYMLGLGIYRLPDLYRIETGGLGFTSITGMVELGDSLIVCGKGLEYSCAVWPSRRTFSFFFVNSLKYINGYLWIGYHGFGAKAYRPDFSDTITIRPSDLGGFGYVFDLAGFNGKVYILAWNAYGSSRIFEVEDTVARSTGISGSAQNLLYSTGDYLLVCSETECKFYDPDLRLYGSVGVGANVIYGSGDSLLFGTSNGLYVVSPSTLTYSGPYLAGRSITGIWKGLDGRIWVADDRGIEILDGTMTLVKSYTPNNSPLAGYPVSTSPYFPLRNTLLANPDKNRMYIATESGVSILTSSEVVSGWERASLVYPNPARRGQTVRVKNCPVGARLVLFSASGVKVAESRTCEMKHTFQPGLYFLSVIGPDGRKVYRLILTD